MGRVSIPAIADAIVGKHALSPKDAEAFVAEIFNVVAIGLEADGIVKIKGLGTFRVVDVAQRESINVNTGERVLIEGHGKIAFTPDPLMRDMVNKPFAHFETVVLNEGVNLEEMGFVPAQEAPPEEAAGQETVPAPDAPVEGTPQPAAPVGNADIQGVGPGEDASGEADGVEAVPRTVQQAAVPVEGTAQPAAPAGDAGRQDVEPGEDASGEVAEVEAVPRTVQQAAVPVAKDAAVPVPAGESTLPGGVALETNQAGLSPFADGGVTDGQGVTAEEAAETPAPTAQDASPELGEAQPGKSPGRHPAWTAAAIILALVLGLAAGYYLGHGDILGVDEWVAKGGAEKAPGTRQSATKKAETAKAPRREESPAGAEKAGTAASEKAETGTGTKEKAGTGEGEIPQALKNAFNIVRTGAYDIVGTDQTIRVRKGETLQVLSKRYLGDGMESYVRVHNGIVEVEPGMSLDIPKLKYKQAVRKRLERQGH